MVQIYEWYVIGIQTITIVAVLVSLSIFFKEWFKYGKESAMDCIPYLILASVLCVFFWPVVLIILACAKIFESDYRQHENGYC